MHNLSIYELNMSNLYQRKEIWQVTFVYSDDKYAIEFDDYEEMVEWAKNEKHNGRYGILKPLVNLIEYKHREEILVEAKQ